MLVWLIACLCVWLVKPALCWFGRRLFIRVVASLLAYEIDPCVCMSGNAYMSCWVCVFVQLDGALCCSCVCVFVCLLVDVFVSLLACLFVCMLACLVGCWVDCLFVWLVGR